MNKVNFTSSKRIVIKIGSSIITKNGDGIDNVQLKSIVEQIAKLVAKKKEIVNDNSRLLPLKRLVEKSD